MRIRLATPLDQDDICDVNLSAFPDGEREIVSQLAAKLLAEETTPQTFSLVAEVDGAVVGHVGFSPVKSAGTEECLGYILAPLGVRPEYQKQGIGSQLIKRGMQQLKERGVELLLVYGDPTYYSRFGFSPKTAERYRPPYPLQYPFGWLGIALKPCDDEEAPVEIACVTSLCDPMLW